MAISKPVRSIKKENNKKKINKKTKEKKAKEIINRGGSSTKAVSQASKFEMKNIQLRLYNSKIEEIDSILEQFKANDLLPPTFSRQKWFEEAIEEKIKRDNKTLGNV